MNEPTVDSILAEYIHNALPVNLIYVPEMRLMGRNAIRAKVQAEIEAVVDDDLHIRSMVPISKVEAVRHKIRSKLSYAILSHRWSTTGELTFRDMDTLSHMRGPRREGETWHAWLWRILTFPSSGLPRPGVECGYDKLRSFCERAAEYGCEWAWADTCCIDKRSSAELDESIRSMYRWYRDAKICIVHLRDTKSLAEVEQDSWFTRGWTLQELLSPRAIKFFNRDWQPLIPGCNDKKNEELLSTISRVTEIPEGMLTSFTPGVDFVEEKILWASQRRTTKVEDAAYSLVGLFDVSLRISYGEGDKAFYRLQEAVMEVQANAQRFQSILKHTQERGPFTLPSRGQYIPDEFRTLWRYGREAKSMYHGRFYARTKGLQHLDWMLRPLMHRSYPHLRRLVLRR